MEDTLVSFTSLPRKVDEIFSEIKEIKSLLKCRNQDVSITSKIISLEKAVVFLREQGFPISKSRIYKLTAMGAGGLPFRKFGNRLVFDRDELMTWCKGQIQHPDRESSINAVVKSAQRNLSK